MSQPVFADFTWKPSSGKEIWVSFFHTTLADIDGGISMSILNLTEVLELITGALEQKQTLQRVLENFYKKYSIFLATKWLRPEFTTIHHKRSNHRNWSRTSYKKAKQIVSFVLYFCFRIFFVFCL